MGKGKECSESETIQLCRSWLETSEDANKSDEDKEDRSETAINGRWKKLQPEVTKYCGVYGKQEFKFLPAWKELKAVGVAGTAGAPPAPDHEQPRAGSILTSTTTSLEANKENETNTSTETFSTTLV
ncbi:hypothetical protein PHYSODRAFT_336728 [Phytophthora sojae]|uniref:No apical meristem-associated C-terminal domain-containing protein n=1 Tax=Phytophthora sojae (strain P6497) TaxID=1094619 RepID=G4ZVV6_PHYSP|nr:hypothetical protein PHYSODRAFT_336728 [Phytophthora sojae]EGZ12292.1 hypothetical protein PHYSODRAFT_336728 [Phytophthora sojae]|eukprot:XP_009532625.1 hypothetical protein PHYSODRAFT_336728 [Phytophthora sojae]